MEACRPESRALIQVTTLLLLHTPVDAPRGMGDMGTTTKKDLIDRIVEETGIKRSDVKKTVQCFLESVIEELRDGNRLEFRDFGVFEVRERAARVAQNPKTLEQVEVPPKKTVKFKTGRLMKLAMEEAEERKKSRRARSQRQQQQQKQSSTQHDGNGQDGRESGSGRPAASREAEAVDSTSRHNSPD